MNTGHERQLWSEGLYSCDYIDYGMESQQQLQQTSELGNISEGQPPQETEIPNSIQKAEIIYLDYKPKLCACGCGKEIIIKPRHHKCNGIPNYIWGHTTKNKHLSKEAKANMSKAHIGIKLSDKTRKNMSNSFKGRKFSEEHKKNIGRSNKGKIRSEECRKNISLIQTKRWQNPEYREKMNKIEKGRVFSEKWRKHISESSVKKWKNDIYRKNVVNGVTLSLNKPEVKLKKSKSAKKMWQNPEYREKMLKKVIPKKDSKPELKLQNILKENNIIFEKHKAILGQPDIFIQPNICVFADGCYFHLCKTCRKIKITNQNRDKDVKDKQITETLQSHGYTVLRFWEHDINKNIQECLNKIKGVVENGKERNRILVEVNVPTIQNQLQEA